MGQIYGGACPIRCNRTAVRVFCFGQMDSHAPARELQFQLLLLLPLDRTDKPWICHEMFDLCLQPVGEVLYYPHGECQRNVTSNVHTSRL
jgi:hypothetical protein